MGLTKVDIHIDVPHLIEPEEKVDVTYDPENDDVRTILRDICSSLANVPGVSFTVVAGGIVPVSVRRDLAILMEQLSGTLVALRQQGEATLDLYEQGLEQRLVFSIDGDSMRVTRRHLLDRGSPIHEASWPRDSATESLRSLARTFVDAARRRSPERAAHPWFAEWAEELLRAAAP
jgi:hypothetical protein